MLKRVQKVRDLVEEVTYIYADIDYSLRGYIKEASDDESSFDFVVRLCKDIEDMCNTMIHKDVGFCDYLEVHEKLYRMLGYITSTNSNALNEWIAALYNADDECCRLIFNIMNI